MKLIKKILKFSILGFLLLISLLFLFSQIELWRGSKASQRAFAELEAKGNASQWIDLIPDPIPDEQNLALTRVMTGCFSTDIKWNQVGEWQEEPIFNAEAENASHRLNRIINNHKKDDFTSSAVLLDGMTPEEIEEIKNILSPYQADLKDLREAVEAHPKSYLPGDYSNVFELPTPSFGIVRSAAVMLFAESLLALENAQTGIALRNCQALKRIANLNPDFPYLINVVIETAIWDAFIVEILASGIQDDAFDQSELETIVELTRSVDLVSQLGRGIETEFAAKVIDGMLNLSKAPGELFETLGAPPHILRDRLARIIWPLTPAEGWSLQVISRYMKFTSEYLLDIIDQENGTIDLNQVAAMKQHVDEIESEFSIFDILIEIFVPNYYYRVIETTLDAQRRLDLVQIAAKLSLSAKQGTPLPDSLTQLSLDLPSDPATQDPFAYERMGDGFQISSPAPEDKSEYSGPHTLTWHGNKL